MTITEQVHNGVTVLGLKGNLMGETEASPFQEKKFQLLEAKRTRIVLDLSQLKMINSSGLGSLIAALVSARERGGDLRLARLSKAVATVMEKVQLDTTFRIFETVDDAVSGFKGPQ